MELVFQNQARLVALAGLLMKLKIRLILFDQGRNVFYYQHIFRVEMGGGIAEIKTSRNENVIIDEHHFVMGDQIAVINIGGNTGGIDGVGFRG